MKLFKAVVGVTPFVVLMLLAGGAIAAELSSVNLRAGVTDISQEIYGLHMYVFWVCVAIGVVVYGIMIYTLIKHRKSVGAKPAKFSHSTVLEIIWTAIPVVILTVLVVPSIYVLEDMYDASDSEVDILITGYQWKWKYEYLDHNYSFFSNLATKKEAIYDGGKKDENYLLEVDNELVIPVGKKVRFLVTSNDVIHSWWVPDFAVKKDAIPGYINEAWTKVNEEGVYRGQCAELCGKDHGFMPIVVRVVSQGNFDDWIASKATASDAVIEYKDVAPEELITAGKSIYETRCAACHQVNGQGNPPLFPALAGNSVVTSSDPEEVIKAILFGRKGTAMQAFGEQLTMEENAAIMSYIRNSWGNKAPVIQAKRLSQEIK